MKRAGRNIYTPDDPVRDNIICVVVLVKIRYKLIHK